MAASSTQPLPATSYLFLITSAARGTGTRTGAPSQLRQLPSSATVLTAAP